MTHQNSIIGGCKAIILDMDGVIVDSEPIHGEAFGQFLEKLKVPYTEEFIGDLVGHSVDHNIHTINEAYFSDNPIDVLEGIRIRDAIYLSLITSQHLKPLEGIESLVLLCIKNGIKLGLASSSVREQIDAILKNLSDNSEHHINFQTAFDATVGGNEVVHKKPAPDIYQKVIEELGIAKNNCIAIEDSGAGILSAKANNIFCIALRNQYLKEKETLSADLVVNSIHEVVEMLNLA